MSTEIPILYNRIRNEFNTALKNAAEGQYVPRPKSLDRYSQLRREAILQLKQQNKQAESRLASLSSRLAKEYPIDNMMAADVVLRAMDIEERLKKEGALFGSEVFNFAIDRPVLTKKDEQKIIDASNNVMVALQTATSSQTRLPFPRLPMTRVETEFENLALTPNAARIDFILTEKGPKIIEINSQWVDAINALSGFAKVCGDLRVSKKVVGAFVRSFRSGCALALIDIPQTTGSRELGATKELGFLAEKAQKTGFVRRCEVVNPEKIRLSYLKEFDAFYINCDPRFFGYQIPDWLTLILERVAQNPEAMFPSWRPMLDKKFVLSLLCNGELKDVIASTVPFSEFTGSDSPVVLKGDGYSLNSVVISTDPNFSKFWDYAKKEPNSYVIQPFLEGKRFSVWVYDSGTKKIKFVKDGYTKLNVWYLNSQVVGMLITISDSPYINDRAFNTVPLIK